MTELPGAEEPFLPVSGCFPGKKKKDQHMSLLPDSDS